MGSLRSLKTESHRTEQEKVFLKIENWLSFGYPLTREEEYEVAIEVCRNCRNGGIHCPVVGVGGYCQKQTEMLDYVTEMVEQRWGH